MYKTIPKAYLHFFNDIRITVVQVRLSDNKLVQIIFVNFLSVFPCTATKMAQLKHINKINNTYLLQKMAKVFVFFHKILPSC